MGAGDGPLDAAAAGLRAGRTVAFVGGRGAGRTMALRELAAQAGGRRVVEVRGRLGFADRPLAVFGEFGRGGPAAVVEALLADGTPPLITVDDPHHLGDVDLAVLGAAAQAGARLAYTATSEAPVVPALAELLVDAQCIPLPPLDHTQVEQLAGVLLGSLRLDAVDVRSLAEATGGRPGLVVRLLAGANVEVDGDLAVLPPDLSAMPGAIAWRRARVPDASLHQICRLAARTPALSVDEVADVAGGGVIERALADGLLTVDGERLVISDPLLAATLGGVDRRTHGREDADALLRALGERAGEPRRRRWLAEAGEVLAPGDRAALMEELLDRDQPHEALRLGAGDGDTPRLSMATARAQAAVGAVDAAVDGLQRLLDDASTPDDIRGAGTLLLGDLLWFRRGDAAAALRVLDSGGDVTQDAIALADILRSALGQPLISPRPPTTPSTPVARQLFDLRAVLAGRVTGADVAPPTVTAHASGIPLRQRSFANRRMAALYGEGARTAASHTEAELTDARASGRPGALALGLAGRAELERFEGRLVDAERTLRAARARARIDDEAGMAAVLAAVHASVLAELGRLDAARDELPHGEVEAGRDLRVLLVGAPAAIRIAAVMDVDGAVEQARTVLTVARASGHVVWGVHAALHAARIGLGRAVVDQVDQIAVDVSGSTAAAVAAIAAFADGGSGARRTAAQACAATGQRRVAAELLLAGGTASEPDRRRAAALLDGLGPPDPALGSVVGALTDRERQVAALAAAGHTSRAVARQLGLSVRTVDNHLRRVYAKLGLEGRHQLAQVLTG